MDSRIREGKMKRREFLKSAAFVARSLVLPPAAKDLQIQIAPTNPLPYDPFAHWVDIYRYEFIALAKERGITSLRKTLKENPQ